MKEFKDIKIKDIDERESRNIDEDSGYICFVLSGIPDMDWKSLLARHHGRNTLEWQVTHFWVRVSWNELPQLKIQLDKEFADTNRRYRKKLEEDARKQEEQRRKEEAGKEKLSQLRQKLFGDETG